MTRNRTVVIAGRPSLQNELLANLVDENTGYDCRVSAPADLVSATDVADALVILDIEGLGAEEIVSCLFRLRDLDPHLRLAVINADRSMPFEQFLSWPAVHGIFYRESSVKQLLDGIDGIFGGEYWLPRRLLSAYLARRSVQIPNSGAGQRTLTGKETETLRLLAEGNSTQHIARTLKVSPHTVKTHLYNLFRKIGVSNRIQAVQWALRNRHDDGAGSS